MGNCLNCGKEVKGKFCDTSCQNQYNSKLKRQKYDENPDLCKNCGKPLSWLQHKARNKFCSSSCSATFTNIQRGPHSPEWNQNIQKGARNYHTQHPELRKTYTCVVCGEQYYFEKGVTTKSCCSKDCSLYLKTHRKEFLSAEALQALSEAGRKSVCVQGDARRSKNEMEFFELCKKHFQNVTANDPIFKGWDADVIVHDYKIAVLWNGVWHYKDIYKGTSLEQIQNRDRIKEKEIVNKGYIPYIITDMGKANKKFVEQEFDKFLKFVHNLQK